MDHNCPHGMPWDRRCVYCEGVQDKCPEEAPAGFALSVSPTQSRPIDCAHDFALLGARADIKELIEALEELMKTNPCDPDTTGAFWRANQKALEAIKRAKR